MRVFSVEEVCKAFGFSRVESLDVDDIKPVLERLYFGYRNIDYLDASRLFGRSQVDRCLPVIIVEEQDLSFHHRP